MDWLQRTGLSELAYKNTCRYCMGHAYSKTFFVVYLKFNFIGHPVIFSGNPAGKTSLEGGGHSPSVNQSRRSGLSFRRRDWETAPLYQGCVLVLLSWVYRSLASLVIEVASGSLTGSRS